MQEKNIQKIHEAIEWIINDEIWWIFAQWKELLKENETLKKEISLKKSKNERLLNINTDLTGVFSLLVKDWIIENKFEEYSDCDEYGNFWGFQSNKFIYKWEIIFEDYVNI